MYGDIGTGYTRSYNTRNVRYTQMEILGIISISPGNNNIDMDNGQRYQICLEKYLYPRYTEIEISIGKI